MIRRGFPPAHASVPNLAPMIDVVMVILIFFMLGTSFTVTEGRLGAGLFAPAVPGGAAVEWTPTIRISLKQTGDGACHVNVMGVALPTGDFEGLRRLLSEKRAAGIDAQNPVVILAERDVAYENVIRVMDACRLAGYSNLQLPAAGSASIVPTP
jgi:biopolymer transport protein ExbD